MLDLATIPIDTGAVPRPTTLMERIDWILAARQVSARDLSRQAGLSHSTIGGIRIRAEKLPTGKDPNVATETLKAIAQAGGVDFNWLATGEGAPSPGAGPIVADEDHEARRFAAAKLVEIDGLSEKDAWWVMRDVKPSSDDPWGYYAAARAALKSAQERDVPRVVDTEREVRRGR